MYKDWLQKRVTVAEAEAAHTVPMEKLGPDPVPFGLLNARWRALLSQLQEGDELWEFCSPPWTSQIMAGRRGISLVRNGQIVASIVTRKN